MFSVSVVCLCCSRRCCRTVDEQHRQQFCAVIVHMCRVGRAAVAGELLHGVCCQTSKILCHLCALRGRKGCTEPQQG